MPDLDCLAAQQYEFARHGGSGGILLNLSRFVSDAPNAGVTPASPVLAATAPAVFAV
jgi:hypothetical protein